MPHVHTIPLLLFVLFDIAYVIACLAVYFFLIRNTIRRKSQKHQYKMTLEKIGIVVLTLFSVYMMNKWILMQIINGCAQTFFWNPTCYDLNQLNRLWLIIYALVGINAIVLTVTFDLRAQARRAGIKR